MGMAPDSSVYPRVLCLAPAWAPARTSSDGSAGTGSAGTSSAGTGSTRPPLPDRIERVVRQLDAAGVRQVVICARAAGAPRRDQLGERTLLRRIGRTGAGAAAFPLVAGRSLLLLARTADVLHLHHAAELAALPLVLVTARAWDIPLVISLHESHFDDPAAGGAVLRPAMGRRLERAAARSAAAVVAPTRALAERLAAAGVPPQRLHVVPSELKEADTARQLLEIYRAVWARHIARRVAIWHPTTG